MSRREVLQLAASVERNSQHPLAEAVVRRAEDEHIGLMESTGFDTYGGQGVAASVGGQKVLLGSRSFFAQRTISLPQGADGHIERLEGGGQTVVLLAVDDQVQGLIAIADTLKESAGSAVAELHRMNLDVIMITGDNARAAQAVAREAGIAEVFAGVLPQDKAGHIRRLQEQGQSVAFVGDGINDAPALAQADLGVAIGGGTDVAIASGQVVLMRDDLADAVAAVQLGRQVMSRIRQNLFWAFAYNSALIPLAAGALYPFFGIAFRPELAGLAMALSSVTVVTLSLMLKRYVPPVKKSTREGR
jgi:Cu+-exporting ATPase